MTKQSGGNIKNNYSFILWNDVLLFVKLLAIIRFKENLKFSLKIE